MSTRDLPDGENANGAATGLVWRPMISTPADIPALNGHTDTVPDIVGRLGSRIDLAIFTEGNHFPALLSSEIIDPFRSWARSHSDYSTSSTPANWLPNGWCQRRWWDLCWDLSDGGQEVFFPESYFTLCTMAW